MTNRPDPRLNAYRPDLADDRLTDQVEAERFVEGQPWYVTSASAPVKASPDPAAMTATELLRGEAVGVFEVEGGWAWVQAQTDGYVGYVEASALAEGNLTVSHRVSVPGTFVYPMQDLKYPPIASISMGARLALGDEVETRNVRYRLVHGGGAVIADHVTSVDAHPETDFVAIAEKFLNVPYLWGGRTNRGLDCSALVQISMAEAGMAAPRDSDMQAATLGDLVEGGIDAENHPGDLVFWPGHVGIMIDREYMIHASGHHMMVVIELLSDMCTRLARSDTHPTCVRRLQRA